MRACPACGGYQRRTIAPAYFECTTPVRQRTDDATTLGAGSDLCGNRYMDSGSEGRSWRLSTLWGG